MVKQDAINLLNDLPDNVTWDDVMYHMYVRQKIERGKDAARQGKVYASDEARRLLKEQ
ncbi:hypothetical protein FACS1894191_4130 [Clostridia bacterium]|nr:hypothetical protein FACS1894191_4130 [Clostridia bacterium]